MMSLNMKILDFIVLLLLKKRLNSVYAKVVYLFAENLNDKSAFSQATVVF